MLEHAMVPAHDPFSHSIPQAPWVAHEWLSEVILAATFNAGGGWPGIVVITALSFAITMALLNRFLLRDLEPIHALLFVALAYLMATSHLLARPHVLAMPLMVIWVAQLVRASEEQRAPSLWLPPLITLWANLHGGFTLGLALAFVLALEEIWNARARNETLKAARSWAAFIGLSMICALITPHGIQGVLFTLQLMGSSYALDQIAEWRSPDFHRIQPLEIWLLVGLAGVLHQGLRLPLIRLLLLLGLVHLALKYGRNADLLGLLAPLFLASPLAKQWKERSSAGQQVAGLDRFFRMLAQRAGPGAVAVAVASLGLVTTLVIREKAVSPGEKTTPTAALHAVKEAHLSGPVFNAYNFGGYLIFTGIPTFIDGRADMYGDNFFKDYMDAVDLAGSDSLSRILTKYRIEWTLLSPGAPAVALLDHLPGWRRLHTDQIAVVHVRNSDGDKKQ